MGQVLAAGALLGTLCLLTDQLRSGVTPIGQLASPWVVVAAWAGSRARGWSVAAGLGATALVQANAVYFLGTLLSGEGSSRALLWTGVALAVGPLAGLTGLAARLGTGAYGAAAFGLLATFATAEAVVVWKHIVTERTVAVAVALLVTLTCCALAENRGDSKLGRSGTMVLGTVALLGAPASVVLEALLGSVGVITT